MSILVQISVLTGKLGDLLFFYVIVALLCGARDIKGLECFVLFVSVYVVCSGWAMA